MQRLGLMYEVARENLITRLFRVSQCSLRRGSMSLANPNDSSRTSMPAAEVVVEPQRYRLS